MSVLLESTPLLKTIRKYIQHPAGVFSISLLARMFMRSFQAFYKRLYKQPGQFVYMINYTVTGLFYHIWQNVCFRIHSNGVLSWRDFARERFCFQWWRSRVEICEESGWISLAASPLANICVGRKEKKRRLNPPEDVKLKQNFSQLLGSFVKYCFYNFSIKFISFRLSV